MNMDDDSRHIIIMLLYIALQRQLEYRAVVGMGVCVCVVNIRYKVLRLLL